MAPFTNRKPFPISPIFAAATLLAASFAAAQASAQTSPPTQPAQLEPVVVTGRSTAASVAGWGDVPLSSAPFQAAVVNDEQMKNNGVTRLADLVRLDPGISDAYNTEGYWDYLTVRGFVLDNRYNYRRDGLPISAETSIPLDNKAQIEVLKGTSGIQAGTSAPGGLVNYVVKRPLDEPLRSVSMQWQQAGTVTGGIDLSQRFGIGNAFGLRVNAAAAHLDPLVHSADGERRLLALAGDWRVSADTLLEAEIETSHRSQPSVPGFSMLGNVVPAPGDPRINLNNQPWSLPVVLDGTTGSLRWQQRLAQDWRFTAHLASQRLSSDDRAAFPFGCTDPNPPPNGTYYADRYCPNGNFDLYDYRSEDERRQTDAIDLSLQGQLKTGPLTHGLTLGMLQSKARYAFPMQAYNYVGTGNVNGTAITPPDPTLTGQNTNSLERSTELYLRDAIPLGERSTAWLGLRHARLDRQSVLTDGTEAERYVQSFTTPWLALSHRLAPGQLAYASWGEGVESTVVPNQPRYVNSGQVLAALKSRQAELGFKGSTEHIDWSLAWFDIVRPQDSDAGSCDDPGTCVREPDGRAHHRGLEATGTIREAGWEVRAGTQWLHARIEGTNDPAMSGLQPTNVPAFTLRLQASRDIAAWPGLQLQGNLSHESSREVLPDNTASIPGYSRIDVAARREARIDSTVWTWRAGIDNLLGKRAWRESPYEFSHVYLFPLAPRTLRVSIQADL